MLACLLESPTPQDVSMDGNMMLSANAQASDVAGAKTFLSLVDEEVSKLLNAHGYTHVALLLSALDKDPIAVGEFFGQVDLRNGQQTEKLLAHLQVQPDDVKKALDTRKEWLLGCFPKTTTTGSGHSYAGFSTYPGTRNGTVHITQANCFIEPILGVAKDKVATEIGFLRTGGGGEDPSANPSAPWLHDNLGFRMGIHG